MALITHELAETLQEQARSLIPGISRENVLEFIFALPPLAEQQRVVVKIDELMALCNQLETSLKTSDDARRRLLDALLAEALASRDARTPGGRMRSCPQAPPGCLPSCNKEARSLLLTFC